jgi:N6-L-threonylcarbamoyladenine synthase
MLIHVKEPGQYQVLGGTLDDAAGEAFDKIAKFLGLGFPGGPAIEKLALTGDRAAIKMPRPLGRSRTSDFSFSGLKTAVVNMFRGSDRESLPLADIAAGFQEAVVDVLVSKTLQAARRLGAPAVSVTGGVSINARLREAFSEACRRQGLQVFFPRADLCTDNAAMVAAAGAVRLGLGDVSGLDLNAVPNAPLESIRCPATRS